MKTNKEYKQIALDSLKDNWGLSILILLVIGLVESAISASGIGGFLVLVLSGPISVGLIIFFTNLINKEKVSFETPFEDIAKDFASKTLTYLLMDLYIFLWSILFIIPGIVKSYSYALTMYIRSKNSTMSADEVITLSRKIMDGKKLSLFYLHLSFIGWFILSVLTFGIGFIFLMPYFKTAVTAFYIDAYNDYMGSNIIENNTGNNNFSEDESQPEEIIIEE